MSAHAPSHDEHGHDHGHDHAHDHGHDHGHDHKPQKKKGHDHGHGHSHHHGHAHGSSNEKRLTWALILVGVFMLVEVAGGIMAHSLALIADAGHMLTYLTRTVKPWGNIGSVGLAQGYTLNTTVMPFILRGVSLLGIHSVEMPRAWRLEIWKHLASDWKPAQLKDIANRTVSLEEVPAVCAELIASQVLGRTIVRIGGEP